jgi:hypothetical protein
MRMVLESEFQTLQVWEKEIARLANRTAQKIEGCSHLYLCGARLRLSADIHSDCPISEF